MVSEARPGPARLALPLLLGLRDGPLSSAPPRAPLAPGAEARARAWGARAAGALSAHTAASPVHEPGSPAPSRHRGPLSSSFSPSSSPSSSGGGGGGSSRPELTLLAAPLGSAPRRGPRLLRSENSPEVGRKVSVQCREPRPPPPRLRARAPAAARRSPPRPPWAAGRGGGGRWGWGRCLSVCPSARLLLRGVPRGESLRRAPAVTPLKAGHSLCPGPSRCSPACARSPTPSVFLDFSPELLPPRSSSARFQNPK